MALSVLLFEEDCRADAFDLAFDHNANSIGKHVSLLHRMRGQDDGTSALHLLNQLPDLLPHLWVQASGWLVEENDARVTDGCNGETQSSSHSATETFHFVLALSAEADHFQQFLDLLRPLVVWDSLQSCEHLQVLLCSNFVPKDIELRTQTDVFPYLVDVADALSIDDDLSFLVVIRIEDACEDVDQSCLSCSVVAQNSHQFAWLDLNTQFVDRVYFLLRAASSEGLAQALDTQPQSWNAFF